VAIASPYAVFRAADLDWPRAMPGTLNPGRALEECGVNRGRNRRSSPLKRQRPARSSVIQGNLFAAGSFG
jgi:hypothetical protein